MSFLVAEKIFFVRIAGNVPVFIINACTKINKTYNMNKFKKNIIPTALAVGILLANFLSTHAKAYSLSLNSSSDMNYTFNSTGNLKESSDASKSSSPYWWLNSGALLSIQNGVGKTLQGDLSPNNPIRLVYNKNKPVESDNGSHPQNIFRLLTKQSWENNRQQIYLKINGDNLQNPKNRNPWNALSLASRYINDLNYYYVSLRMDGNVSIKKKAKWKRYHFDFR